MTLKTSLFSELPLKKPEFLGSCIGIAADAVSRPVAKCVYTLCETTPMPKTKPIPTLTPEQIKRFWSKVDRRGMDACWEWQGAVYKPSNHGAFNIRPGRQVVASRISYYLAHNTDPGERFVCHACDNPRCMNPRHFFLGAQADNMDDCRRKGRTPRGETHGRHKLTCEQVEAIRAHDGTCKAPGAVFGISAAQVCLIRSRKKWKHNAQSL
jgi:hypothetical protein